MDRCAFPGSVRHGTLSNPIRLIKLRIDFQCGTKPYLEQDMRLYISQPKDIWTDASIYLQDKRYLEFAQSSEDFIPPEQFDA